MYVAKIIRHRHKHHHYVNDDLKEVTEDAQFKIIFSLPSEMQDFKDWVVAGGGEYKYNKELSKQEGTIPKAIDDYLEKAGESACWCDIMTYYLLHVAGYDFHSTIHPYKGEVYIKK